VLTKAQKKKIRDKKNKILKTIKDKIDQGEEFPEEEVTSIATKWMETADVDGSGTIDFTEFVEMIAKLDDKIEEGQVKELFSEQDADGNVELSVEHFG
jgi:Ca2+-binding EF-hand superfamily protein